jgi:triosephosphate isomerase
MRKKIIAGNWKMNKTLEEGQSLTSEIKHMVEDEVPSDVQVVICPPFIHLTTLHAMLRGSQIGLGAQNCSEHESGAYTGETSAAMLLSGGVQYVILGHSERREYFNESNELLASKVNIALKHGLKPIFCCGEPLEIRERDQQDDYVKQQVKESLLHLPAEEAAKVIIAYEPIWAIGTGKTASSDQAQEMHAVIRRQLADAYGQDTADNISILYGGSMKPANAAELLARPDVDGGLIGGASLKSRDFVDIAKSYS